MISVRLWLQIRLHSTWNTLRAVSSIGRAFGLHPKGHRFEPYTAHSQARRRFQPVSAKEKRAENGLFSNRFLTTRKNSVRGLLLAPRENDNVAAQIAYVLWLRSDLKDIHFQPGKGVTTTDKIRIRSPILKRDIMFFLCLEPST